MISLLRDRLRSNRQYSSALILSGLFLFSVALIMIPSYTVLVQPRKGNFDLYPIWYGGRTVLAGGEPYSLATQQAIQLGMADLIIPSKEYQHGFAHPANITFVLLPLIVIPFSWAILLWISLQIPLLVVTFVIGLDLLQWQPRPGLFFLLGLLITFGFRYPINIYVLGQIIILVIFCMVLAIWLFRRGSPRRAGAVLALSTIRPDLTLPAMAVALLLTYRSPKRAGFIGAFLTVSLGLALLPVLFIGFWPVEWLEMILIYGRSNPFSVWPVRLLSPAWVNAVLLAGAAAWVAYYVRLAWRRPDPFHRSLMISAAICFSLIILPQTGSYNLTFALIPAVILFRYAPSAWLRVIIAASLLLPWLYFWLGKPFHLLIFLLIPGQFMLLQELARLAQRRA